MVVNIERRLQDFERASIYALADVALLTLIMLHARTSHDSCACLHTYVLACVQSLQGRKGENLSRFLPSSRVETARRLYMCMPLMRLNVVCSLKKGR